MNSLVTFKIDLGISAQNFLTQFQNNNRSVEEAVKNGIEKALEEICADSNFEMVVKESVKQELYSIAKKAVMSWEVQNSIQKMIAEKVGKRIEEYADKIADKITSTLQV